MNNVITAQMMNNLPYTVEIRPVCQEFDILEKFDGVKEASFKWSGLDHALLVKAIKEHLDTLAKIESEDNYAPLERTRKIFENALKTLDFQSSGPFKQEVFEAPVQAWSSIPLSFVFEDIFTKISVEAKRFCLQFDCRRQRLVHYLAEILQAKLSDFKPCPVPEQRKDLSELFSMFVFRPSDEEAAIHYLNYALENPNGEVRIKVIYVQEEILASFKSKLERNLRCYPKEVSNDPLLQDAHKKTRVILKKLNAKTITPRNCSEEDLAPVVCYEFDLSYFPPNSSVVVLKVFRTAREAIAMAKQDKICNATIWTENIAVAYEMVKSLDSSYFYINCLGVDSNLWRRLRVTVKALKEPFQEIGKSGVSIEGSHHFEYFNDNGLSKLVAFPFGISFAN